MSKQNPRKGEQGYATLKRDWRIFIYDENGRVVAGGRRIEKQIPEQEADAKAQELLTRLNGASIAVEPLH